MAILMTWWSMAEMLPPFVHSPLMLGVSRLCLGLGEAGVWIVGPKAVGQYFLPEQRGTAIGIYTSGATLGAAIAPPLIASMTGRYGWQSVFVVTGLMGLVWVAPWLLLFRESPALTAEVEPAATGGFVRELLGTRNLWLLLVARLITDPVWYFYLFWYPKFLTDARHQTLSQVGRTAWVVYLAADIGAIGGGSASGWLIRRGLPVLRARRIVMTAAACLLPLSPLVALAHQALWTSAFAAVIAFAHLTWMITLTAVAVDLFPKAKLGTAFGFISAGSGIGGLLAIELIPHVLHASGYFALFAAMGALHPIALLLIWRIRQETPQLQLIGEAI
jgi:ACS family hexuronate transporter-like MFS transporter